MPGKGGPGLTAWTRCSTHTGSMHRISRDIPGSMMFFAGWCMSLRLLVVWVLCRKTAEVLASSHPVVQAILDAKTRRYQGCYKVCSGCVPRQLPALLSPPPSSSSPLSSGRHGARNCGPCVVRSRGPRGSQYPAATHSMINTRLTHVCDAAVPQVHMPALVATADRPPGDLMSELSALSQAKEIGYDAEVANQALAWRLLRQPEDWDKLVDDAYARCDKV